MKLEKVTEGTTKRRYDDACGTALALEFLGERWSMLVLRELMFGPRRFGAIKANLPGISANVLTQRLEAMEAAGILIRRKLAHPANVPVYELTRWGYEAEPIVQVMGRWAARSRRHDPFAFMSTASAMQSLLALVDRAGLADWRATIGFRFPDDGFLLRIAEGDMTIARVEEPVADTVFSGDTMAMRRTIYGKQGLDAEGLLGLRGDPEVARRFVDLFRLPEKIA
ncbi:transcriptional regulator [Sphingomonas metalli]|uniref:Transcriptional regulator n=1 Tax=Sphingomonas metalli TaxID=1779358 RepID=A0A916T1C8_9SPHN|nr:helix-turn-helix domain-containing protein [Sphingomonas metalli]GGB27847.1 transcriptional regulator [Sphingomonas metalli]